MGLLIWIIGFIYAPLPTGVLLITCIVFNEMFGE
jgi:hypothetical protein